MQMCQMWPRYTIALPSCQAWQINSASRVILMWHFYGVTSIALCCCVRRTAAIPFLFSFLLIHDVVYFLSVVYSSVCCINLYVLICRISTKYPCLYPKQCFSIISHQLQVFRWNLLWDITNRLVDYEIDVASDKKDISVGKRLNQLRQISFPMLPPLPKLLEAKEILMTTAWFEVLQRILSKHGMAASSRSHRVEAYQRAPLVSCCFSKGLQLNKAPQLDIVIHRIFWIVLLRTLNQVSQLRPYANFYSLTAAKGTKAIAAFYLHPKGTTNSSFFRPKYLFAAHLLSHSNVTIHRILIHAVLAIKVHLVTNNSVCVLDQGNERLFALFAKKVTANVVRIRCWVDFLTEIPTELWIFESANVFNRNDRLRIAHNSSASSIISGR